MKKKKQEIDALDVSIETTRSDEHPKIYTTINMHFKAQGPRVDEKALARSIQLSFERYCPANAMLQKAAEVSYTYEIVGGG